MSVVRVGKVLNASIVSAISLSNYAKSNKPINPQSSLEHSASQSAVPASDGVIVFSDVFPPAIGGSGEWLWQIYSRLPPERVTIVTSLHPLGRVFDERQAMKIVRTRFGFDSWGLTMQTVVRHLNHVRQLSRLTKARAAVELHVGKALPEGWTALILKKLYGLPFSCFVHGEEICLATTSRELEWMTRSVLHGARRLIANSESTRALLLERWGVASEKVSVLHPGVDTEAFVPAATDKSRSTQEQRAELGWGGRRVILTVGRLQRRKGHDAVIEVLPSVVERYPDVLYAIVGDGEERQRLEALVVERGLQQWVQFRGSVGEQELLRCYQHCEFFVLANRREGVDIEGFGIVLIEAQACGKAVIAGNTGGTQETLRDGLTGRVVSGTDRDELRAALLAMLSDAQALATMGARAREWVCGQFDVRVQARKAKLKLMPAGVLVGKGND
ncbi:MAG: phosphatidylinositol alpha-1,6-mannosyltransferase [Gammaproteobacteria bacterium]